MPENTEKTGKIAKENTDSIQSIHSMQDMKAKRKKDAVRGVALFGLLQTASMIAFIALCFIPGLSKWAVVLFAALAVLSAVPLAIALVVLKQRFDEIQGGELDAARQY